MSSGKVYAQEKVNLKLLKNKIKFLLKILFLFKSEESGERVVGLICQTYYILYK